MSLHRFLTRLIWICVLPLIALAAYLAIDSVHRAQTERDKLAVHLAANFATAIDQSLSARIAALQILAVSPLADQAPLLQALYQEAQGFRESFDSHVILADLDFRMLFNTRVPFGSKLPALPRPAGHSAVESAIASGKPAVGDTFAGPLAGKPLIAIAVPGLRDGKTAFFMLAVFETAQFQSRLDLLALPPGWSLTLLDGKGDVIAHRAPPGLKADAAVDDSGRFVVESAVAPWSVVLEIPRDIYRAPLIATAIALIFLILGATLAGVFGGTLASRRLGRSLASLTGTPPADAPPPEIEEIASVRRLLDEAADRRDQAEAAQRESEQRFRATFEQAAVGIALLDPDGRWLRVNQKLCDIVGYGNQELLGKTFQDITHPDDLHTDLAYVRQILAGEIETYSMEKRYLRQDGSLIWINLTVALARRPDGRPDYFISVIEDIQKRKEAEAELQASEASLKEAQRLAGLGNWSWELREDRHVWSEEIYRIYGRALDLPPAVYPEVSAYFTAESWTRLSDAVTAAFTRGLAYECDAEVVRSDGTRRWVTARGECTRDADGAVVGLHGTVQDITERKQAAEALRELNASLEQRVEQRTAELLAANKELDTFAYSVSHDLRAPLRAMRGFAQALTEDYGEGLEDEAKSYLEQINVASRKMGELIDGILALSRSTRGNLRNDTIDLSALAAGILAELAQGDPGRAFAADVAPGLIVRGDARMVEAIMRNLLGNAWKYTAKKEATTIRVYSGEIDGLHGICIADNGAGFDMAHAEQLFQPFRRLHRQDEFPGLGIGLATVQRIVGRHGGQIRARAAPGEGATFCFTLAEESAAP